MLIQKRLLGQLLFSQSPSPSHLVSSAVAYSEETNMRFQRLRPGSESEFQSLNFRPHLILNVRQATAQRVQLEVAATTTLLPPLLVLKLN